MSELFVLMGVGVQGCVCCVYAPATRTSRCVACVCRVGVWMHGCGGSG